MVTEIRPASPVIEDLPQLPPVARCLWEAREWLSEERWWRGGDRIAPGQACVVLSIYGGSNALAYNYLWRGMGKTGATKLRDIYDYNDDPATTYSDILALFDRAIELAVQEGK